MLRRVLAGTVYDVLPYQFHEERGAGGEYIPVRQRRPSIRYALCRTVVEDSVALLFSEGHFPAIVCADTELRTFLADLVRDAGLGPDGLSLQERRPARLAARERLERHGAVPLEPEARRDA